MSERAMALPRAARLCFGILTLMVCAALAVAWVADAKTIRGTGHADKIHGTSKKDRINARGGDDVVNGGRGNDKIKGAAGADKLRGAKGKDRLAGGKDGDTLNAVDNKRDKKVNGGAGADTCVVDQVDLDVIQGCETVQAKGDAPQGSLVLTSATGLVCASQLPTCTFQLDGTGADAPAGSVIAGGGAVLGGASVSVSEPDWTAAGTYGCTDDGFLRVTIGSESVDVPITCNTAAKAGPALPTP
jgi:RTX calcium-binding nonapeptide repeat (4 copies)